MIFQEILTRTDRSLSMRLIIFATVPHIGGEIEVNESKYSVFFLTSYLERKNEEKEGKCFHRKNKDENFTRLSMHGTLLAGRNKFDGRAPELRVADEPFRGKCG